MTHEFKFGEFRCLALSDGVLAYPPAALLANAGDAERSNALRELGENPEEIILPYICLYIDTGRNKILVDTGLGPGVGPHAGKLLESLAEAGIRPEEADTVVLSHGHPDHIGGVTDGSGAPNFPNARHVLWESEWNFWTSESELNSLPPGPFRDLLVSYPRKHLPPIQPNLELVDKPSEVAPGIEVIPTPGHTIGHISLLVTSRNERLLVMSDGAVHRTQLEHPDWCTSVDYEPDTAVATRRSLLDQAAADELLVMAYHFPFPGLGSVVADRSAWRWEPTATTATAH